MDSALWGLLGTIAGAGASIATSWLNTNATSRLQRERLQEERREKSGAFQRQTLLDLQEAIHDTLRLVSKAHIEDTSAFRSTKEWGKNMLSDELSESIRLAQRRVAILTERLSNDTLRAKIKALLSSATSALMARGQEESGYHMEALYEDAGLLLEELGAELRTHS